MHFLSFDHKSEVIHRSKLTHLFDGKDLASSMQYCCISDDIDLDIKGKTGCGAQVEA